MPDDIPVALPGERRFVNAVERERFEVRVAVAVADMLLDDMDRLLDTVMVGRPGLKSMSDEELLTTGDAYDVEAEAEHVVRPTGDR